MNKKDLIALLNRGAAAIETPNDLTPDERTEVAGDLANEALELKNAPPIKPIKTLNIVFIHVSSTAILHSGSYPIAPLVDEIIQRGGAVLGFNQKDQSPEETETEFARLEELIENRHPGTQFLFVFPANYGNLLPAFEAVRQRVDALTLTILDQRAIDHIAVYNPQNDNSVILELYQRITHWMIGGFLQFQQQPNYMQPVQQQLNVALEVIMTAQRMLESQQTPSRQYNPQSGFHTNAGFNSQHFPYGSPPRRF